VALIRSHKSPTPLRFGALVFCFSALLLAFSLSPALAAPADSDRIRWEPVPQGQLKLDDKIPLKWNVWAPEKKLRKKYAGLLMVLLGRRYLALDAKSHLVYAVFPSDLQIQGENLESGNPVRDDRLLPSHDWSVRDAGPAELVRVTLGDYDRVLEVQLPHPPDLRYLYP
jgi:hypothetical protein